MCIFLIFQQENHDTQVHVPVYHVLIFFIFFSKNTTGKFEEKIIKYLLVWPD